MSCFVGGSDIFKGRALSDATPLAWRKQFFAFTV